MPRPWPPRLWLLAAAALAACEPSAAPDAGAAGTPLEVTGDLVLVDDGAAEPGFAAFRDTLRAVVARRDTAALLAATAPDARLSYDDAPGGARGMRERWLSGRPAPTVWDVLGWILEGGSVDEDGAVTVPSVAALWPDDLDPTATVAVPGQGVPAYAAPGGPVVATVTEAALPAGPADADWQTVTLPDGRDAVVARGEALSPAGWRAVFWDDGDGWRLRSLLSDDA